MEDIIKYKEEEKKYLYELEEQAIKEKKEKINKFKSKILKKDNYIKNDIIHFNRKEGEDYL